MPEDLLRCHQTPAVTPIFASEDPNVKRRYFVGIAAALATYPAITAQPIWTEPPLRRSGDEPLWSVEFLFYLKGDARLLRDIQQIIYHGLDQRDTFFASDGLRFPLGIAGD